MEKLDRIKELVALLNKAGKSYYSEGQEIMSNYEYDALYDELKKLEEETGTGCHGRCHGSGTGDQRCETSCSRGGWSRYERAS